MTIRQRDVWELYMEWPDPDWTTDDFITWSEFFFTERDANLVRTVIRKEFPVMRATIRKLEPWDSFHGRDLATAAQEAGMTIVNTMRTLDFPKKWEPDA